MGNTTTYGFRYPELGSSADGPLAFQNLANDVENELKTSDVQTYTPTWGAFGLGGSTVQPSGAATRLGRYTVDRGVCTIAIELTFGGGTNGGRGQLYLTLPNNPRSDIVQQKLLCTTYVPSMGTYPGYGTLFAGIAQIWPEFPWQSNGLTRGWISTDATGGAGLGSPIVPGNYPIQPGGNFILTGSYLI